MWHTASTVTRLQLQVMFFIETSRKRAMRLTLGGVEVLTGIEQVLVRSHVTLRSYTMNFRRRWSFPYPSIGTSLPTLA